MTIIETPSPNFDDRALPVTMIVLHYTGMRSGEEAIARLRDPAAKVSSHYLIAEDGTVMRMVAEDKRAWHAGKSHWREIDDVNSASVGIEIVNPGHEFGYRPFPAEQIEALIPLVADIKDRHGITRGNIVGHSDIAPARKRDPGELFPWSKLARVRLALPRPTKNLMDPGWTEAGFCLALERFGYDVTERMAAIMAFQRRFRPELVDGEIDAECRMILLALLLPKTDGGTSRGREPEGRATAGIFRDARGKSGLRGTTVPGNARLGRPKGKCHREQTAQSFGTKPSGRPE